MEVCTGWNTVAAQKRKERDSTSRENALNHGMTCPDWWLRNSGVTIKRGLSDCFGLLRPYKPPQTGGNGAAARFAALDDTLIG